MVLKEVQCNMQKILEHWLVFSSLFLGGEARKHKALALSINMSTPTSDHIKHLICTRTAR